MAEIILVLFGILLIRIFLNRNMPRVGGKIGPRQRLQPPVPVPDGFSRVYGRAVTLFVGPPDAADFSSLKDYLRRGPVQRPALMHVYRVAGCKTEIEIPAAPADYQRIDAREALAFLRELPDPRLIRRLHLRDEPSFLDPWVRKVRGQSFFLLGNATNFGLIVLNKPDRRLDRLVGLTLLHEWLHIVAFGSAWQLRRFNRANAIEPLAPAIVDPISFGMRNTPAHEAWSDLGEKILGYDEMSARDAALATPVHAMILWQRVERILRKTPARWRSTRFDELEQRGSFMRHQVAEKARNKLL
jgi:hypothetical protein